MTASVSPEVIDYGRKLTKDEIIDCISGSGESYCCACGDEWVDHHVRCAGSTDNFNQSTQG